MKRIIRTIRMDKFVLMGCSQSPLDVTTANLLKRKLVKNVVEPQKFDQELRVSYKPTAFRRWVVDEFLVCPMLSILTLYHISTIFSKHLMFFLFYFSMKKDFFYFSFFFYSKKIKKT